jgi:hypothetical protein
MDTLIIIMMLATIYFEQMQEKKSRAKLLRELPTLRSNAN